MQPNYIAGEWVDGTHARQNINPSDLDETIGEYAQASPEQTAQAIEAAGEAGHAWARTTAHKRAEILDAVGAELARRREELGRLLAREEGKTLTDGMGEVSRASQIFKFFAGAAVRLDGRKYPPTRPDIDVDITREPVGVVGIITPWNFPIAIPAWKIAPALAYGNTVVFKPADLVPACAWALTEILHRAGVPQGVFNLVMGRGTSVGQVILEHRKVNAVTFTGSVQVGKRVAQAVMSRFAKVQMEMGGKNPLIMLDDADLDNAVECAVQGAFFQTGQRCTASSRLIVQKGIHNRFVEAVQARLAQLKVGHALATGTHIGPVVDEKQLAQNLDYVRIGKEEGAHLAFGGERVKRDTEGYFFVPALFTDCDNQMHISREEIFGPVAGVIPVANYDEALTVANDTEFGLSSGICTRSLKYATDFKRNSEAGMVMVNCPTAGVDYHVPFGGRKASSYGSREQGDYAVEFFTTVKTSYTVANI